jgi:hypothetical protein
MRSVIDSSGSGSSLLEFSSLVVLGSVSSFALGQLRLAAQHSCQSSLALVWSSDHSYLSILNRLGPTFRQGPVAIAAHPSRDATSRRVPDGRDHFQRHQRANRDKQPILL